MSDAPRDGLAARTASREAQADARYAEACAARRAGDEAAFRQLALHVLRLAPGYPLVFSEAAEELVTAAPRRARVLVAHPEPRVRDPLLELLVRRGHSVLAAATLGAARAAIRDEPPDAVLFAPELADGDALAIARLARKSRREALLVLLTCVAKEPLVEPLARFRELVDLRLDRPFPPRALLEGLEAGLQDKARRARPGAPLATGAAASAAPGSRASTLRQTLLVLGLGYGIVLGLNSALERAPDPAPGHPPTPPPSAARSVEPPPRPRPRVGEAESRAAWARRTSLAVFGEEELQVTALTPMLAADRVYREAGRLGGHADLDELVDRQVAGLDFATRVWLAVQVRSTRGLALDPVQVARSLRLRVGERALAPLETATRDDLRFVRETGGSGAPRLRSLSFLAAFARDEIAAAPVLALDLQLGEQLARVYLSGEQLGADE